MSKRIVLFLSIFIFSTTLAYSQDEQVTDIRKLSEKELKELEERGITPPPGMEIIKVGNHNILLPKGKHIRKKGGILVLETTSEYVSRKLLEMKECFTHIDTEQEELKKEIEELKKIIGEGDESDTELLFRNLMKIEERFAQIETKRIWFKEEIEQLEAFNTTRGADKRF
jgi:hypothetical protein